VRAGAAVRRTWPRRLDLRRVATHDFPLKAAAVLIAVVFAIANAQNAAPREIVAAFDGRVPVERPDVPTGFVLRGQLGDVGVTLRGPEGVADRMGVSDLHATLDLTGIDASRPEPHDAKVLVTVSNGAVKVVDVTPATVSVRLERITSRNVVVQTKFANEPPKGSQAAQTSVSPKEVRIVGPESAVAQIAAVFATVRFGDVTTDLTQSAPAIPVDANGLPIDGLQVEPGVVVVSVPLLPTATTRTVPLLWSLHGTVAAGYWSSRVTTDPVAVTISGDQAVLANVERIDTAAIDVTGLTAPKTFRVPLLLPDGVTLLQPVDVSVTVTVVPLAGTRPFLAAVQIQNVGSGLVGDTDPGSVTVTVNGPAPALTAMTVDQVVATVDATGKPPGTYTVDVVVRVPVGATVQSVQPVRVTLTMRSK
jgi:YbbR domain-containing protein